MPFVSVCASVYVCASVFVCVNAKLVIFHNFLWFLSLNWAVSECVCVNGLQNSEDECSKKWAKHS